MVLIKLIQINNTKTRFVAEWQTQISKFHVPTILTCAVQWSAERGKILLTIYYWRKYLMENISGLGYWVTITKPNLENFLGCWEFWKAKFTGKI